MFTGIIKAVGTVSRMEERGGDLRLIIRADGLDWGKFATGESIAINGVCLTAVMLHDDGFETDVSRETLAVTSLANLAEGARVNIEPSLEVGERMGGHIVSGHVDCLGTISARDSDGRSVRLTIDVPSEYMRYIASKGSVCLDGVSLTVNEVSEASFGVNIIPHTAQETIIGEYVNGSKVNIEVDVVARYLESLLDSADQGDISKEFLRAHGYV